METLSIGQYQDQVHYAETLEVYRRNSDWWAVFACFDLARGPHSARDIARLLSISESEAEEALEALRTLGFLKKDGQSYASVPGKEFMPFNFNGMTHEENIERHALVSQQILNDMGPRQRMFFDHRCFALNEQILSDLYKDIAAAFDRAFAKSQLTVGNDKICKMTFTAVDVLKKD